VVADQPLQGDAVGLPVIAAHAIDTISRDTDLFGHETIDAHVDQAEQLAFGG